MPWRPSTSQSRTSWPRLARASARAAATVAAVTDETPRPVTEAADVLVRATPGVHEVLSRLAAAVGA